MLPPHAVVVGDVDAYPELQVQSAGCAEPPAHTLPTPHPAVRQVEDVVTHALDVVAVDAYPGEQEHAVGWAPFSLQNKPDPHAVHVPVTPAQPIVVVDVDA